MLGWEWSQDIFIGEVPVEWGSGRNYIVGWGERNNFAKAASGKRNSLSENSK